MSVALRLYEQLTEAQDEKTKARLIAGAIEELEDRYPNLKEVATQADVRESELRLQKEIEQVRLEIKAVEIKIAETRADLVRWVVGVGLLQTTLISGVLLKVAHLL